MKWSLLGFILIASLLPVLIKSASQSSYNKHGHNYISGRERELLVSKAKSIQSFLFPDTSSLTKSSFADEIDKLPIGKQCKQFFTKNQEARFEDRTWAHELEDAQGKIIYGVMKGNTEFMGDFDECVNLKVGTENDPWADADGNQPIFTGRYCTVILSLKQDNSSLSQQNHLRGFKAEKISRLGFCSLTACSKDDLSNLMKAKFEDDLVGLKVTGCDGPEEWQLASTPSLIRFTFGALITLLIAGTILDRVVGNDEEVAKPFWVEMITSFSAPRNLRSILVENATPEKSRFINVLKAICMLLVLHGHGPLTIRFVSLNSITGLYYMLAGPFQAVVNAGFLAVDFFLFTSAFISVKVVFPRFRELFEQRARLSSYLTNVAFVLGYRYMRIIPSLVFLMMMHIWSENFIAGPLWREYVDKFLSPCRNQWLPNILMLTNVLPWNPEEPNCAFHSWYLGLDMQLFIFSLVFFIILGAIKPRLAITLNLIFLALSIAAKGVMTYFYNYPPTVLFGNRARETLYFSHIYTKPWFRADPYILGLLFGYFTMSGHQLKLSKVTKIAIHTLVIGAMLFVLKVPFFYHDVDTYATIGIAAYGALHRTIWALCLGWIFYSSYSNDFPILTKIADWHIWEVLSNVSYQFFLFHPLAYFIFFGTFRTHFSKGQYPLYISLTGIGTILLLATLVLPAVVEWPISNIMKIAKNRLTGKKMKKVQ
ncbi:O-acyltransferase like protein [Tetranychus urticae]|uniref:Uncharacterized protein n=1 Tax=Tetranychus urticae TaxID=32264 RepID=T1L0D6_TETUR|nr:O-acyltransferase like protein [Tetranychus urticae]XP_015792605.1 O-acyltransferase like protein [Tetranychus urticae]